MKSPLIIKLGSVEHLTEQEEERANSLCRSTMTTPKAHDIISEGTDPQHVHLIIDGWAAPYSITANGGRRITAFLIPGDFCDIHVTTLAAMDHSIIAITDCMVGYVDKTAIDSITRSTPLLTRAFWRATLVDEAILRRWLVNSGRKDAYASTAHLLCELHLRLRIVGRAEEDRFDLPLTQQDLADAVGLTSVHVNRVMKRLREDGLIEREQNTMRILDLARLCEVAEFNPNYLHLHHLGKGCGPAISGN